MKFSTLRAHCAGLPGAVREIKWGVDEVFTVGAKMFAHFGSTAQPTGAVMFKAGAERFLELTDRAGVEPAPYLARAHWVLVRAASDVSDSEMKTLISHSYTLVFAKLSRVQRDAIAVAPRKAPPAARKAATSVRKPAGSRE